MEVAIRFRWIWVEKGNCVSSGTSWNRRNPLSLDMGWKEKSLNVSKSAPPCRNPLSLDMGWKVINALGKIAVPEKSQSAFAGYGLKRSAECFGRWNLWVAIRFRWIWVEKFWWSRSSRECLPRSQSAFAGYGLKSWSNKYTFIIDNVAIRFRWIWVEKGSSVISALDSLRSQSAFAGYGLKRIIFKAK